jgi:HK97 family phage major capsid protein
MQNERLIHDLADSVKDVAADVKHVKAIGRELEDTKAQITGLAADVSQYRALTERMYGKSGGEDYRHQLGNFIKAAYHKQRNLPMPSELKAAADYVTTTDAQGGYLVPDGLRPAITAITEVHGKIFPRVTKVTIPPGQAVDVPYDSTLPTMTWRTSQGSAGTEDAGPIAFGADTLRGAWLHDYVKLSNELLTSSSISIADAFAVRMISKGVRAIETGILVGDDSGDHPHDGIITDAGSGSPTVHTQSPLATPTFANVATFFAESIEDHEGLADETENVFITTPSVAVRLATEAVGSSELKGMLTWGDPRNGVPGSILGYDFIRHPACYSTTHRVVLAPLSKIVVGWTGTFSIDFNAFSGWTHNETWMMVSTHADYVLGNKDMYSHAVVTALS